MVNALDLWRRDRGQAIARAYGKSPTPSDLALKGGASPISVTLPLRAVNKFGPVRDQTRRNISIYV